MKETPSLRYIILGWYEHVIKLEIIGFPITEKVKTNIKIIGKNQVNHFFNKILL